MNPTRIFNASEILAALFPFPLPERRPARPAPPAARTASDDTPSGRFGGTSLRAVIPSQRQAPWPDAAPPGFGRETHVLCDDCLGPAVVEVRVPRDPAPHEVCGRCAQAPYYIGGWVRPLPQYA